MQYVAVWCNVLQRVVASYSILHRVALYRCGLQYFAMCCSVLQCVVALCSVLQYVVQ